MSNPFKINDLVKHCDDNDTIYIVIKTTAKTCHVRVVRVGVETQVYVADYTEFYPIVTQGVPVAPHRDTKALLKESIDVPKVSPSLPEDVLKVKLSVDDTVRAIRYKIPLECYTAAGWYDVKYPENLSISAISSSTYRYKPRYITIGDTQVTAPIRIQDKCYDDQPYRKVWGLILNKNHVSAISISSARYKAVHDKMNTRYWLTEDEAKAALNALNSLLEAK